MLITDEVFALNDVSEKVDMNTSKIFFVNLVARFLLINFFIIILPPIKSLLKYRPINAKKSLKN